MVQDKKQANYPGFIENINQYLNGGVGLEEYNNMANEWVSGYCFQEDATIATTCGGLGTGTYSYSSNHPHTTFKYWCNDDYATGLPSSHDGDYDTWCSARTNYEAILYMNYTKPVGATAAILQVKVGNKIDLIQLSDNCFNYQENRISVALATGESASDLRCYDPGSTGYESVRSFQQRTKIYEEAIYWVIQ